MTRTQPTARWIWPILALAAATIPVAGLFTLHRIFYVRDLTLAFRSRFLFLRHSLQSGTWPMWDPYPGNGQSAVNDALYQLFHLPSLLIRLALPEVVAFNLWVALPVPIAALGAYLYLRRHVSAPAAALGAFAFAAAGPIVSTTNFPNMSWSVAVVPYVFWSLDRILARPVAAEGVLLAAVVGSQALAGEPVTLAATLVIAAAYVMVSGVARRDIRTLATVAAAVSAGLLLAAIQFLPLLSASRHSVRGLMRVDDFWSFHPLALLELAIPHFFGDYFNSHLRELAWMVALNSQREPYYYTMYIGVPIMMAATLAALSRRPRTMFWTVVVIGCIAASLGPYTPFYPALQAIAPPLRTFRFPVKYLSIAAFGVAVLASFTIDWLLAQDVPQRAVKITVGLACAIAVCAYGFVAWLLIAPVVPVYLFFKLALLAHVSFPVQGAESLIFRARPLLTTLFLKLVCCAFLLWIAASTRRERRTALIAFAVFAVVDLLAANSSVNPTMPIELIAPPAWTRQIDPNSHQRIYVGGRLGGEIDSRDIDAPKYMTGFDEFNQLERRYLTVNEMVFSPSGWRLRESISFDLPVLWPIEYARMLERFEHATRDERLRFVTRAGARYVILPTPPSPGAKPLATLRGVEQLKLYDVNPGAQRAYVVPDALLPPDQSADVGWQIEGMFQERFDPRRGVLAGAPPPPAAGTPGKPLPPSTTFLEDGVNRVVVRATLPADGYLALFDTYDPSWAVDVDGTPATLMRANGLFRAVHLTQGEHVVSFTYRPRELFVGAAITIATALALAAWWLIERSRRREAAGVVRAA